MSDESQPSFADVFAAVRRVVEARGVRTPGESLITYEEGGLRLSRTPADEYEVRAGGKVVFRSRHTGGLSSEHAFQVGGWVEEVRRLDRIEGEVRQMRAERRGAEKGGKK